MNDHEKMLKIVIQNLEHELPAVHRSTIEQVARVILGEDVEKSMGSLAVALLQSNVSVGHILSALLRCEWLSVQHLIETTDPGNIKQQVKIFSDCVDHFNVLQTAIIDAADQRWQGVLDKEVKLRVVAELRRRWRETGEVHLHNYFDEIPVSARVDFKEYNKGYIWVSMTRDLVTMFAASPDLRTAYITSPDRAHSLIIRGVNKSADRIMLEIAGVEVSLRERRRDVRVKLTRQLPITLTHRDQVIEASIVDISCTGVGVKFPDEGISLLHNEKVGLQFQLGSELMKGDEAVICWSQEIHGEHRVGINFKPKTIRRETVYRFIFVQEQAIIGRLRKLETPSWMKDPIELRDPDE
ncbi:PilZ domain-containing protein [Mariprofundus sp. KV]|uniref:PilZ domain-containing protein n=1 Tax=Mariprofundus sp. KV TaxID=2608715 RepID=UPI0015A4BEF4|nr:PilZ domain-containing protein [Mariprofundus sp. KV]NWF37080.1 PilZ domain-containing protein [Mariprofundus sp. KV]